MRLQKSLAYNESLPNECIENAVNVLKTGNLYRYSCATPDESEVALLEREFGTYVGAKYVVGVNSCASGLYIALLCAGVKPGDKVLMPAFTYTAVPSAIVNANAVPVLIECTEDYVMDVDDFESKITDQTKVLLITYMRGHVPDMDRIVNICRKRGIFMIEDSAHAVGSFYKNKHMGTFGLAGCFSTQSHKLLNSGEGGLIVTNDEMVYAKAVLYAGSQETFWAKHFFHSQYFSDLQLKIPNISLRMSNVAAAILRPQISCIQEWTASYNQKYNHLRTMLASSDLFELPMENEHVKRAHDTIQFRVKHLNGITIDQVIGSLAQNGISMKRFSYDGDPRYYKNWKYIHNIDEVHMPGTDEILQCSIDLRLPLWLTMEETDFIGYSILNEFQKAESETYGCPLKSAVS